MTIKIFFLELITDAKSRPEIKVILGIPIILSGVIYGLYKGIIGSPDWIGFAALSSLGLSLLGTTALTDSIIDKNKDG